PGPEATRAAVDRADGSAMEGATRVLAMANIPGTMKIVRFIVRPRRLENSMTVPRSVIASPREHQSNGCILAFGRRSPEWITGRFPRFDFPLMDLVRPETQHLASYVDALRRGWSPNNERAGAGAEELERVLAGPETFLAQQIDPEGRGPPVKQPDGSVVP